MAMGYLLDTNIITAHLKNDEKIRAKIKEANFQEENLYISIISYYETKRGLLYANATRKLSKFNTFCEAVTVAFLDDIEIMERAAAIHADLRGKGTPLEDSDILIAATAIARDSILLG